MARATVTVATGRLHRPPIGTAAGDLVRRIPLALLMIAVTTMLAIVTGALSRGTPASVIDRFGYSLDNLRAGHLYVLPISDWLVFDAVHWSSMVFLFALFAAPLEAIGGSALLAETFWLGSWGGTIVASLTVRLLSDRLAWYPHPDLVHQADVGGSVGAWACAGALIVVIGHRRGRFVWPVRIGAGVFLGYQLAAVHGSADVAHAVGFLIGSCLAAWQVWRRRNSLPEPGRS